MKAILAKLKRRLENLKHARMPFDWGTIQAEVRTDVMLAGRIAELERTIKLLEGG